MRYGAQHSMETCLVDSESDKLIRECVWKRGAKEGTR